MNYVSFFVQMDSETGLPEFFLDESMGNQHDVEVDLVRERLESMRLRLRYCDANRGQTEYDLSIDGEELVLWELEPEDDCYETTTSERISMTIAEIEYQLEILVELEPEPMAVVNWKVEGF